MDNLISNYNRLFLFIFVVLVLIVSFFLIKPFITPILIAFVLSYTFYPLYTKSERIIKNKSLRAFVLLFLITLVVSAVSLLILNMLINESVVLYRSIDNTDLGEISNFVSSVVGENINLDFYYRDTVNIVLGMVIKSLSDLALTLPQKAVNLFIMFFIMYYLFKEGEDLIERFKESLPLRKDHSDAIMSNLNEVMYATIYGIIVTSVIQGLVGTLGLFVFRVDNPIVWGIIMTIAAMFPYFGAALVWLPIALIKIANADMFNGIGLLVYGAIVVSLIDNIIRPKIISNKIRVHPIIVLLGIFGGIQLFGFVGLILGPVLLGLLVAVIDIYNYEIKRA
ncbi:AI-2E family transporter [Candidatus Woesearchaeota archaeon]|nr:AI-2E family transporter [Candidatus Woesearchaeota archaeon]